MHGATEYYQIWKRGFHDRRRVRPTESAVARHYCSNKTIDPSMRVSLPAGKVGNLMMVNTRSSSKESVAFEVLHKISERTISIQAVPAYEKYVRYELCAQESHHMTSQFIPTWRVVWKQGGTMVMKNFSR